MRPFDEQLTLSAAKSRGLAVGYAPLLLALASALLYAIHLDRPPHPDELYHILAARGLLESGEPRIAEGLYTRAYAMTWIVAQSFRLFGESLAVARLPSLIATVLLVVVLFLWVRREAGETAAWLAAGLYAVSPFAVLIAQLCRPYALQTLAVTLGLWLIFTLFSGDERWQGRLWRAVAAAFLFAFATLLQVTTLLGLAALACWAGPVLLWRLLAPPSLSASQRFLLIVGLGVFAGAALIAASASGLMGELWRQYRTVPLFNAENQNAFWFYHFWYLLFYPALWPAVGVLALLACSNRFVFGSFVTVIFAAAFLLNSFAGPKNLRYIAYAQPLLFVIWGMGLAALLPALRGFAARLQAQLGKSLAFLGRHAPSAAGLLVSLALLLLVLINPFWLRTAAMLADWPLPGEQPSSDWRLAARHLAPLLEKVTVVVTAQELAPLYFLGRHDILFSPSKFGELPPDRRRQFGRDVRTGRPVISSLEALARVLQCYESGLFVAEESRLGKAHSLSLEVLLLLERHATPVPLPRAAHVRAWHWQHAQPSSSPECHALPAPFPAIRRP